MKNSENVQAENQIEQNTIGKTKWAKLKRVGVFLWNVLAAWAALVVLWFFADQGQAMWDAFVANAADAFEKATSVKMIVLMLMGAIVVTCLKVLIKKIPKRKRKGTK